MLCGLRLLSNLPEVQIGCRVVCEHVGVYSNGYFAPPESRPTISLRNREILESKDRQIAAADKRFVLGGRTDARFWPG